MSANRLNHARSQHPRASSPWLRGRRRGIPAGRSTFASPQTDAEWSGGHLSCSARLTSQPGIERLQFLSEKGLRKVIPLGHGNP
jgi:hypothetical protein